MTDITQDPFAIRMSSLELRYNHFINREELGIFQMCLLHEDMKWGKTSLSL